MNADAAARTPQAASSQAGRQPGRGRVGVTFEDPLSALPETAQKLLLAAKGIIANEGFDALTLNSVAAASGENKAMISYYFGNKAGLVAAVLDSVIHDEYILSRQRMKNVDPARRIEQLSAEMRRMDEATEDFHVFFELLPHIMRDEALQQRMALLYRWYWTAKLEWLGLEDPAGGLDDPDLLGLAQVLSALIDGLAIQAAIDPAMDLASPYRVIRRMLDGMCVALVQERAASATPGADQPRQ